MPKILSLFLLLLFAACGRVDKKTELQKLQKERDGLNEKIRKIEAEISAGAVQESNLSRLVEVQPLVPGLFKSYIEVQGSVQADENVTVSAEMGGTVTSVKVREGDEVQKGQLLAELDNKVMLQGIAELQSALDLATTLYEKQKNLWEQKIGTEVQFLSARNQKESLEKKMGTLRQQVEMTRIKSPISGIVDAVEVKTGQMTAPGYPALRVVNFSTLKVKGDVAESFAGKIKQGDIVEIYFPDYRDTVISKVSYAERVINPLNRTFSVYVKLDNKKDYHPNMMAVLKIMDYARENSLSIPVGLVQESENGRFVMLAENNKAKKVSVKTGRIYHGMTEILTGIKAGEKIIIKGYQDLNDGEAVKY